MDLNTIAKELFAKVRGRFPSITIGDEEGNVTSDPELARYFEFTFKTNDTNGNKISISLDKEHGVVIMYADDVTENELGKDKWYSFLRELRMFSKKRMLNFDVRNITKSNLDRRDYQYLSRRSGDSSMNESKLYGTSKLSYQDVDSARLVIKHTENVDYESVTGRTRNIGSIYIESPEGERFKYPYKHLAGARAMARHVAEGGTTYDEFGSHIIDLSEELNKLRKFKNYMGRSKVMAESLADYMGVVNERIGDVKKRIDNLQKSNYYKEAFDGYEKPVFEDIPEDVQDNWIDQLTIRQFNEELKDVFPYIYKLIGEKTKAKELGPDDFVNETGVKESEVETERHSNAKEETKIESYFNKLLGEWADEEACCDGCAAGTGCETDVDEVSREDLIKGVENELQKNKRKLKDLLKLKAEVWGSGDKETLQAIQRKEVELRRNIKDLQAEAAPAGASGKEAKTPLSEFILSFYDRQSGSFPKGETAVLTMVEKDYGEQFIDPAKTFIGSINQTFEQMRAGTQEQTNFNLAEEGSNGLHAFFSDEKGPNNHLGVALRVIIPHPTAMGGFTTTLVNFWGSMDMVKSGDNGLNKMTLDEVKAKGIEIHGSKEEAMQAAKAEHGDEGGKGSDSHDEYQRLRQLAGI